MDRMIREIRGALEARLFGLALQGSLALVDICGGLTARDGIARGATFKAWFTANLGEEYPELSPEDVWQLRCGILHQGRAKSCNYDALLFTLPDGRGNSVHHARINDVLNLDLILFCTSLLDAVEVWWRDNRLIEPIWSHSRHIVRVRPNGLEPYIVGLPVLG